MSFFRARIAISFIVCDLYPMLGGRVSSLVCCMIYATIFWLVPPNKKKMTGCRELPYVFHFPYLFNNNPLCFITFWLCWCLSHPLSHSILIVILEVDQVGITSPSVTVVEIESQKNWKSWPISWIPDGLRWGCCGLLCLNAACFPLHSMEPVHWTHQTPRGFLQLQHPVVLRGPRPQKRIEDDLFGTRGRQMQQWLHQAVPD